MVSKISMLYNTSLEIIRTYGLGYFIRIAKMELGRQKLNLFKNPTVDYYTELETKIESQDELYRRFVKNFNSEVTKNISQNKGNTLKIKPKFTIVILANQKNIQFINHTIETIKEQIYNNYETFLLSDSTLDNSYLDNKENCEIRFGIEDIQKNSSGDFICFIHSGDKIAENTLFKITEFINSETDSELVYTDHDFYDQNNIRIHPFFKPDWSPYLFQSVDYISAFFITKKEIFNQISFDDDLPDTLYTISRKITEKTEKIAHIQIPLCSISFERILNEKITKNNTYSNIQKKRLLDDAHSITPPKLETNFVNEPLVSIIIPTKNNYKILKRCINSIKSTTSYKNFEIIIVDNNSTDSETKKYFESLPCTVLTYEGHFNFSKMNNFAVKHAKGDFFLFLNDDTKVLERNWLNSLVSSCYQDDVGAVGAKLIFKDGRIQHAGSVILDTGASFHPFQNIHVDSNLHFNFLNVTRECSAVTGACLITKKEIFNKINGFDDDFDVYYGDTDLCVRITNCGLYVLYVPDVILLHDGSHSIKTKMLENTIEKAQGHFAVENYHRFISKWPKLKNGDPYYNKNLGWDYSIKPIE